jgi:hypothetical protein
MLDMRDVITTVIELVGVFCLLVAAFAFDWRIGLATVGVVLLLVGYTIGARSDTIGVDK